MISDETDLSLWTADTSASGEIAVGEIAIGDIMLDDPTPSEVADTDTLWSDET